MSGFVGVKLQLPLATVVEPAHGPINRDRTGRLLIPDPKMVGSAVVVIMLPVGRSRDARRPLEAAEARQAR